MEYCFVMQPFDRDKFDQRYKDTFELAIRDSGLEPYRVDEDPSARIIIDKIEERIRDAKMCFADITTNNPNVWYELGYAFALGKEVVMVSCKEERTEDSYPFDIRHKGIIEYQSRSSSDFSLLAKSITTKLKAFLSTSNLTDQIKKSPFIETEGLNPHEIAFMVILLENLTTPHSQVIITRVIDQMDKAGFTLAAANMSHRTLKRKGMMDFNIEDDFQYGGFNTYCVLTEKGENWLVENEDKIRIRKEPI
ncbi:nucleoside 2-deoxyribosyltransferase [Dyadobacter sp. NIV53]|uniref:nucleoside 2-deoxyribosyltransferase n=1 Tax=Dyadobacter sp. NIV53 TaxID=2861765 RepID=UPI001C8871BC|nr:nucleoside 2-deoxyribosyltransferase [Dyadobacter sp. NIV53]